MLEIDRRLKRWRLVIVVTGAGLLVAAPTRAQNVSDTYLVVNVGGGGYFTGEEGKTPSGRLLGGSLGLQLGEHILVEASYERLNLSDDRTSRIKHGSAASILGRMGYRFRGSSRRVRPFLAFTVGRVRDAWPTEEDTFGAWGGAGGVDFTFASRFFLRPMLEIKGSSSRWAAYETTTFGFGARF